MYVQINAPSKTATFPAGTAEHEAIMWLESTISDYHEWTIIISE